MLEEKVEIKAEEYGDFVRLMREKVSVGDDGIVKISDGLWFGMADLIEGLGRELLEKRECAEKNDDAGSFRQPSAATSLPEGGLSEADGDSVSAEEKVERDSGMDTSSTASGPPSPAGEGSEESSHETEPFFEDDEEDDAIGGEIFGAALRESETIENDPYRCEVCVNAGTPLCESCRSITSPGGDTTRPTRFIGFTEVDSRRQELTVHAYNIVHHIRKGQPLPMRWVMRYNELMCGKGEKVEDDR